MNNYTTTIGIEVHAELKSNTKMFSSSNNNYNASSNTNITLVDFGYPGTLPTLNKEAVKLALKAALLLNCKINKEMFFDRKNYFYPDLPKGYQITQARNPIGVDGYIEIEVNGNLKKIGIHDIHIEEDTAKSVHKDEFSYLDFNRCGVPLIEIVSNADMNNKDEAMAYLTKLREILLYADISDCKMEEGSMRADVNISVSNSDVLGTRTETKNIGSISNVGMVVEVESKRQIDLIESGFKIEEETRRYDEKNNRTILMRKKETGNDYRYFPESDLPKLVLTDDFIYDVENTIPVMPSERRKIYKLAGISDVNIEKIIQNKVISDYLLDFKGNLLISSNLLLGDISAYLNKNNLTIEDTCLTKEKLENVVSKLEKDEITNKVFKDILLSLLETEDDVDNIINKLGITTISDSNELKKVVLNVIENNEESVIDYKNGKDRAIKYLMGQIMKESKGKANPKIVNDILIEELNKL